MNVELSEKWIRRINSPLGKMAGVVAPCALTFGAMAVFAQILSSMMSVDASTQMRLYSLAGLILLLCGVFMGAIGFKVCTVIWISEMRRKKEAAANNASQPTSLPRRGSCGALASRNE